MSAVLGLDAVLYRNEGTYEAPTWTECPNVRDLTIPLEHASADVTSRAANGWRQNEPTLTDGSIEFGMIYDPDDETFQIFRDAFLNRTPIEVLALSKDIAEDDAEGLRATVKIFRFEKTENLEEAQMVNVTAQPSYQATNPPSWYPEE